jgi:hypothetical protein
VGQMPKTDPAQLVAVWMETWYQRFGVYPKPVDAGHSLLLRRLLAGKPLLPKAPPRRFNNPAYDLAEGIPVTVIEIIEQDDGQLVIDEAAEWKRIDEQHILHVPSSDVYILQDKVLVKADLPEHPSRRKEADTGGS